MSGECLCGAYADRGEMRMLAFFYPDVYRYLLCLESKVTAAAELEDGRTTTTRVGGTTACRITSARRWTTPTSVSTSQSSLTTPSYS